MLKLKHVFPPVRLVVHATESGQAAPLLHVRGLTPETVLLAEWYKAYPDQSGTPTYDATSNWTAREHITDDNGREYNGPNHFSGRRAPDAYQFSVDGALEFSWTIDPEIATPDGDEDLVRFSLFPALFMSEERFLELVARVSIKAQPVITL